MNIWLLSLKKISTHYTISNLFCLSKCSRLAKQVTVYGSLCKHPRRITKLQLGLVSLVGLPVVLAEDNVKQSLDTAVVNSSEKITLKLEDNEETEQNEKWERLKAVFELDEFGNLSKELNASVQGTWMGLLIGLLYGGITQSREALVDFMERNQATIYENHLDAKRRLQNHVSIHFAKGAARWGIKLAVFTGGFMLFLTSSAAYRGEARVIDYVMSGGFVGAILRLRLGPPAILIGGLTGAALGLFCGLTTQTLLSFNNSNLDEVLAFQYELEKSRRKIYNEGISKNNEKSLLSEEIVDMMKAKESNKEK